MNKICTDQNTQVKRPRCELRSSEESTDDDGRIAYVLPNNAHGKNGSTSSLPGQCDQSNEGGYESTGPHGTDRDLLRWADIV
jgi:hypothetical protein